MTIIAYARVSSTGQSSTQLQKLGDLKPTKVFQEKRSGVDRDRPGVEEQSSTGGGDLCRDEDRPPCQIDTDSPEHHR